MFYQYIQGYESVMRYFEKSIISKFLGLFHALGVVEGSGKGYMVKGDADALRLSEVMQISYLPATSQADRHSVSPAE